MKRFAFNLALLVCFLNTTAQHISHLGAEDGLNGRHAFNFQQDKKGFIWISTLFGIDRYDGEKIKNYPIQGVDELNFAARFFRVILDNDSALWAYNDRGTIYRYNEMRDEFELYKNLNYYVRTIHFDSKNRIWVCAKSNLGILTNEGIQSLYLPALFNKAIKNLCNYKDNNLLLATNKEVYILDPLARKVHPIFGKSGFGTDKQVDIESIYYDAALSQLWVGTVETGIFLYDFHTKTTTWIEEGFLTNNPILTILPVHENLLFVGTDGKGAWLIDKQSLKIKQSYQQNDNNNFPIRGDGIYDIFRDREGRIWISTYSDGVNILHYGNQGFHIARHERFNENTIPNNQVSGILEDSKGNIWYATIHGLSKFAPSSGKWSHFLKSHNVRVVIEDSKGQIWAGSYADGVFVLNQNGQILANYKYNNNSKEGPGTNFVYTIFEDSNQNIWIGGKRGFISKYNIKSKQFSQINLSQANHITQINKNTLLFACESGVFTMPIDSNRIEYCKFSNALKTKYICDVYVESDSIAWLATFGDGLNRCDFKTGNIQRFTKEKGLNSDYVYALQPDDLGNIWFSSENGLGKINTKTHAITSFFVGDGISDTRFIQLSRAKTKDGKLYFGSYDGVTWFSPNNISTRHNLTKLVLLDFDLFNKTVRPGDENAPIKTTLDETSTIELDYKQHSFSLSFTTINFAPSGKRKYMWKLDGLDKYWVGPTSENLVNYTNLKPNTYTLRIKSLGDNNEVLDERQLQIIITPPFWDTAWAQISGLLLLLAILYWVYLYIRHIYEKRQSENKIRFFINTTHDLRTPLTLISSPIFELRETTPQGSRNSYLLDLIITNLHNLNKTFSQLLDFQKVYEDKEKLVVRLVDVKKLITNNITYWKPYAKDRHQKLTIEMPDMDVHEWVDTEKMNKILNNLVFNSLKYTPPKGLIVIRLTTDNNGWQISITDNGIGIPKSEQKNLFKRFFRAKNAINSKEAGSGLGLLLVHNYVRLHNGQIKFNSVENKGTEFHLGFSHGSSQFHESIMLDDARLPILSDNEQDSLFADYNKIKTKILVVDDNKDLREYLKLSLSHHYKVYEAENGLEAWNKIPNVNPEIVITDLQMPEMDGYELCRKIKASFETSHIPIILLTVLTDDKHKEQGLKTGADDYISKPFDIKYLKIKIDNIINNRNILRKKFLDIDKIPATEESDNTLNADFIEKATKIIEEHILDSRFSIGDFAHQLGLSRSSLYTKFHAVTGYTPNDFIKVVRMKKAIQLFREKQYSINEVAHMTGFSEPAYFATSFRKIYGKSPKQFINDEIG